MEFLLIWGALVLSSFGMMVGYAVYKLGSIRDAVLFFKTSKVHRDWAPLLIIPLLFFLVSLFQTADASDFEYFTYSEIYAGLEVPVVNDISTQCYTSQVDDRLTSNFGAYQNIIKYDDIEIGIQYTHHSCALGQDKNTYNGVGLHIRWRIHW